MSRRRSTHRKSRRGGAKYGKMPDNSSRRRTMSKFVRKTPTEAPGAAMALLAQRVDAEQREDAEFRRQMRGMPRIMVGPNLNNEAGPARSAPGSPMVLPDQNPQRDRLPAFMVIPNPVPRQGPARSAPPSPREGGRSRKTRRRHK